MKLCCCEAKYKCIQGLTNLAGTTEFTIERPKVKMKECGLLVSDVPRLITSKQNKQNKVDLNLILSPSAYSVPLNKTIYTQYWLVPGTNISMM